jgi:hypothetical protein
MFVVAQSVDCGDDRVGLSKVDLAKPGRAQSIMIVGRMIRAKAIPKGAAGIGMMIERDEPGRKGKARTVLRPGEECVVMGSYDHRRSSGGKRWHWWTLWHGDSV